MIHHHKHSLASDGVVSDTLPVSHGGLGIRSVRSFAPSAFLASAESTGILPLNILDRLIQSHPSTIFTDLFFDAALTAWSIGHAEARPLGGAASLQRN